MFKQLRTYATGIFFVGARDTSTIFKRSNNVFSVTHQLDIMTIA